ncbi:hypothetical protein IB234_15255 [Pseudomonas sp. PDM16]|uniref:hypothetical protein n=1 Tax=Pseudomonas sp. PDM16 TaxID=2769292 RepID=UPI0017859E41|nr:hypothetical protein [Pseudomonas sp. PDM16]MBD9415919.1 hypothetical protein [Pseudomonas sp. PDM16]
MSQIYVDANQIAVFVATKVSPFAVPSTRLRADVGAVQIEKVMVREVSGEEPAVRLSFDMSGGFGVQLLVKLREIAADPAGYMAALFDNLHGIRHAAWMRRQGRQAEVAAVYEGMKHA